MPCVILCLCHALCHYELFRTCSINSWTTLHPDSTQLICLEIVISAWPFLYIRSQRQRRCEVLVKIANTEWILHRTRNPLPHASHYYQHRPLGTWPVFHQEQKVSIYFTKVRAPLINGPHTLVVVCAWLNCWVGNPSFRNSTTKNTLGSRWGLKGCGGYTSPDPPVWILPLPPATCLTPWGLATNTVTRWFWKGCYTL